MMSRHVALFGIVLVFGSTATASVLSTLNEGLSPYRTLQYYRQDAIANPFFDNLWIGDPPPSNPLSMKAIRPMRVTIAPASPEPFEEVVATISGKTSIAHLTLEDSQVSRYGNDIEIELEWDVHVPPTITFCTAQCCSAGYGLEQVTPMVPGASTLEPYDVSVSLGSFDVGTYRIHVESTGVLEGEAEATFEIRQPQSTFFNSLPSGWPTSPHSHIGWDDMIGKKLTEPTLHIGPPNETIAP